MELRPDQCEAYWRDGYLLLRGLIEPSALERYESRFIALVEGVVESHEQMVIMQDVMVVQKAVRPATPLHAVNKVLSFEQDQVLYAYALAPGLLAAVRSVIGPSIMSVSTNIINKPPGVDGRHPLHQDLRYFALRPADGLVGAWTALNPATRESGCLAVIPGSHAGGLRPHSLPDWEFNNAGFYAASGVDEERRVHLEMAPGDTLLMHPLLVHGSGQNRTDGFRRAITTHYAARACKAPPGSAGREVSIREIEDAPAQL